MNEWWMAGLLFVTVGSQSVTVAGWLLTVAV